MRPLKLEICAFCSYPNKTIIDFEKLGENGIYLITGNTGAGKTTIFDAITYALYGAPSGTGRDTASLRSKYAPDHITTCVRLTFSHKGKVYLIERMPAQFRAVKEGAEPKNAAAKAAMFILSENEQKNIASNTTEVTNAVTALLGIDHKQFCQIAMIAQGDFAKILKADSNERQQIFRKLFDTHMYEKIRQAAAVRASEAGKKLEDAAGLIGQLISSAKCDENSPLYSDFTELRNDGKAYGKIIEKIKEIREEDIVLNKDYSSKIENCNKEIGALKEDFAIASGVIRAKADLEKAERSLTEQNARLKILKESFDDALKNEPLIRKLTEETANIRMVLPDYSTREQQRSLLSKTEEKLKKDKTNLKQLSDSLEQLDNNADELSKELLNLDNAGEQRAKLVALRDEKQLRYDRIISLLSTLAEYEKLISEQEKITEKYRRAKAAADEAENDYRCRRNIYLDAQAGILAENLTDNQPCPVCGSTHHPAPAKKPEGSPSQRELKAAEALLKTAHENQERASNEAAQISAKKESVNRQAEKLMAELSINAENSSPTGAAKLALSETQNDISDFDIQIAAEERNIKRKSELNKLSESVNSQQEKIKSDISELGKAIAAGEAHIIGCSSEIAILSAKLEHDTLEAAKAAISEKENRAAAMEKKIEDARNALSGCTENISRLNGSISELKRNITENNGIDTGKNYDVLIKECENKRRILSSDKEAVAARIAVNTDVIEKTEKLLNSMDALIAKSNTLSKLSKVVCGNMTGQEKLTLEAYVQAVYFERIIAHANKRLDTMTNGQYALKRKDSGSALNVKCGLDLEIVDYFNDSRRDVCSLSGGESFKASLALALGLADEIQSRTSGVVLDSMFIDEGFGSLDGDSLDQAMSALNELGSSNRIVGIISHVDELKRRIEKKIIVKKISPSSGGASYGTEVTIEV